MSLVNRNTENPWRFFNNAMNPFEFDRDLMNWNSSLGGQMWKPSVDVKETENNLIIKADLPGMTKDQIQIEVDNGQLIISGERSSEKKEDNEKFHRVERSYGSFTRSFAVPEGCTAESINAHFDNGVLELTLPKLQKSKSQKVCIQ
ncbi:hypothetical protein DLAC_09522 [Tieghemostelium lacteum]|uniref:SHSP domain-containing protein n=1 Tax=Tieghemostelium lacteum TaxID=361077 RepID=A0A151Z6I1_TIELA|nr:hypothetical protein DLAC_09522 [Tieghemostelium lacteum]|eukprot:KYQ89569.1 hypothetical protein DLAC_09522 [Tieghemostelium lacteum]